MDRRPARCAPAKNYGVQVGSVPLNAMVKVDSAPAQRADEASDAALPPLTLAPDVPVPARPAGPAGAAPAALLALCPMPLPAAAPPAALLPATAPSELVPAVMEDVSLAAPVLLPACTLPAVPDNAPPAAPPVPSPALAAVPASCARAGTARTADRTKAVVRMRMAITRCRA